MKKTHIILSILPLPFLLHFYDYQCHLNGTYPILLYPSLFLCMIVVGMQFKNTNVFPIFLLGIVMTIFSSVLGSFFIPDDGAWFKPFGRDVAIIITAITYLFGQFVVRWIRRGSPSEKK